jgi:hypothetical protein
MGKHQTTAAFLPRTIHLGPMPTDRKAIEAQIEALIDILDQIDGDADLEPDHESYDACDLGEPDLFLPILPLYGVDQSRGMTNYRKAHDAYRAAQADDGIC